MITRLTEMRNNVEMERAEHRQRSYEDAMGTVCKPGQPETWPESPKGSGVFVDYAEQDRATEARWEARRKSDDELWEWYLAKRDINAHCTCGRFKVACMFSTIGFHRTRRIPRVIMMGDVKCRRCPEPVKHPGDLCGKCQVEQAEVMNDLHR